jgi:hypothetical protein
LKENADFCIIERDCVSPGGSKTTSLSYSERSKAIGASYSGLEPIPFPISPGGTNLVNSGKGLHNISLFSPVSSSMHNTGTTVKVLGKSIEHVRELAKGLQAVSAPKKNGQKQKPLKEAKPKK